MATISRSAEPGGRVSRFGGILHDRMLRYRPPSWWQELLVIAIGYRLYGLVRNAVPQQASIALRHGRSVQHVQESLHLNWELSLNHFVARNEWLAQVMDYYYATLHFIFTAAALIWLFYARPQVYRGARTVLFSASLIGLAGFYLYPLAPPRLLPQYGYIDTLLKFHTWGSLADPKIAEHSNQFAAMPSLHIAWSLWVGVAVLRCARRRWVRVIALLYPFATLLVIMGTANHFFLDAVAGGGVLALGFGVQWLMSGRGAYTPPGDAPSPSPRVRTRARPAAPVS